MTRKYILRRRAERQEETRRRIVEAAVALHRSLGPARTTVSAVAERAGVQRHTVYRHFPDERSLLRACAAHNLAVNPLPDPGSWGADASPVSRIATAVGETYAAYERDQEMIANVLRDRETLGPPVGNGFVSYLDDAVAALSRDLPASGRARARMVAALRLTLSFPTWRALTGAGLTSREAAALAAELAGCLIDRAGVGPAGHERGARRNRQRPTA